MHTVAAALQENPINTYKYLFETLFNIYTQHPKNLIASHPAK